MTAWIDASSLSSPENCAAAGSASCTIISKQGSYEMALDKLGDLCWASNTTTPGWAWECAKASIQPNTFYFVAVTYNGTNYKAYVNGNPESTVAGSGNIDYTKAGNQQSLRIGLEGGASPGNTYFQGKIADAQVYNSVLPGNAIMTMYQQGIGSPPVYGASLAGWWPLTASGSFGDYSGNANNGAGTNVKATPFIGTVGDLLLPGSQPAYGQTAAAFNGLGSNIQGNAYALPFTAAMWVNPSGMPNTGAVWAVSEFDGPSAGSGEYQFFISGTASSCSVAGELFLWDSVASLCTSTAIGAGSWTFIAFTMSPSGDSVFVNGNFVAGSSASQYAAPVTDNYWVLGEQAGNPRNFNGQMADVQLYNSILSSNQIFSLYQQGLSSGPVSNQQLIGWWPLATNPNDYSSNGHNGAPANITYTQAQAQAMPRPIYGVFGCTSPTQCTNKSLQQLLVGTKPMEQAMGGSENESTALGVPYASMPAVTAFDGLGSLNLTSPIPWMGGSGNANFVMSIWIYPTNSYGGIIDERGAPGNGGHDSFMNMWAGTAYVKTWELACLSVGAIPLNQWSNIAMTYNNTGPTLKGYVNGAEKNSETGTARQAIGPPYYVLGGGDTTTCGGTTAYGFQGYMSDFQLYNVSPGISQFVTLYANDSIGGMPANMIWRLNAGANGDMNQTMNSGMTQDNYLFMNGFGTTQYLCTAANVIEGTCYDTFASP
jgi:hypothetical protein